MTDDGALEVILDDAPPPPRRGTPIRTALRRHPAWLIGGAAGLLALAAVYVALAVAGTRTIEREWRRGEELSRVYGLRVAQVREREIGSLGIVLDHVVPGPGAIDEITRAYEGEVDRIERRVRRVVAVDPGVRSARDLVARRIDERAARLVESTTSPDPYVYDRGVGEVEQALQRQRKRWRVKASAATAALPELSNVEPRPLAGRPTGTRLVVKSPSHLLEIDIDRGGVRSLVESRQLSVSFRRDWVAYERFGMAYAHPLGDGTPVQIRQADAVIGGSDPDTVYVITLQGDRFDGVEVDRTGQVRSRLAGSGFMHWVTPRFVVVEDFTSIGGGRGFTITDRTGRTPPRTIAGTTFLAAHGNTVVRSDDFSLSGPAAGDGDVRMLDLASGRDVVLPGRPPGTIPVAAAYSADGRSLAVAWHRFGQGDSPSVLTVHDAASLGVSMSVELLRDSRAALLAWAPSGEQVFFAFGDKDTGGLGFVHLNDGTVERLAVRGEFNRLAAF